MRRFRPSFQSSCQSLACLNAWYTKAQCGLCGVAGRVITALNMLNLHDCLAWHMSIWPGSAPMLYSVCWKLMSLAAQISATWSTPELVGERLPWAESLHTHKLQQGSMLVRLGDLQAQFVPITVVYLCVSTFSSAETTQKLAAVMRQHGSLAFG